MSAVIVLRKTQQCADVGCGKTLPRGATVRQFGGSFYCLEGHDEHREPVEPDTGTPDPNKGAPYENPTWPPPDAPAEPEAVRIVRMLRDALTEILGRGGWE